MLHGRLTTRSDLPDGAAAKDAVTEMLGRDYSTNEATAREVLATLVPSWPAAVKSAEWVESYHVEAGTTDPANPSTRVGNLVRALNDSAPRHLRKL